MKQRKKINIPLGKLAVWVSVAVMLLSGVGLVLLYRLTQWYPLLLTALLQLLPAAVQLVLLLPVTKAPSAPILAEEPGKKERLKYFWQKLGFGLGNAYHTGRKIAVVLLIAGVIGGGHLLFWNSPVTDGQALSYLVPVLLAVLFVLGIALEKWCRAAGDNGNRYTAAQIQGINSMLRLLRVVYLLAMCASMVRLLQLYQADGIAHALLSLLFVYETICLGFSLAVRTIRKELDDHPEVLASLVGMGSDMNILKYLEENTGITMRSLWSLQLVKELLPGALAAIVLVVWLTTGLVQIEANQKGVLFRMGKLQTQVLQPGIHLTLPWPLDEVQILDTDSVRSMAIGYKPNGEWDNIWTESHGGEEYRMLLGNAEEVVTINMMVEYRIRDILQYIKSSAAPESLLEAQAYEIITKRTISTDLDALMAADREAFSESFQQELAQRLEPYGTGIEVVNVVLENIHPAMEIAHIYQSVISAEITAERYILEAQNEANQKIFAAREEAEVNVGNALAEKHESVAKAQSAVTEFMAAVAADDAYSQQYRFHKYISAVTQAYGDAKLIIAGDGVDTSHLYIGSMEKDPPKEEPEDPYAYEEEVEEEYWEEMPTTQPAQSAQQSEG